MGVLLALGACAAGTAPALAEQQSDGATLALIGGTILPSPGDAPITRGVVVVRDGRIILLSQLAQAPGEGIEMLRRAEEPLDIVRDLREASPDDLSAATNFAEAVDWARVYLLSDLDNDLVEDLFCVPVENEREISRLLAAGDDSCVVIGSAQHFHAKLR